MSDENRAGSGDTPNVPDGEIFRPITIAKNVLFVDGVARSGKSTVSSICGSLEDVELSRIEFMFEYIGELYGMGKLERFAAISLLRQLVDEHVYNIGISRNLNFRWKDASSVFRNPNPLRYFKRLLKPDGAKNVQEQMRGRHVFNLHTHDQLAFIDIHFQAWPEALRVIELWRHPLDLVGDWMKSGWGSRFGTDPQAWSISVRADDLAVPFYAADWRHEFLDMTPLGRVIGMLHGRLTANHLAWEALDSSRSDRVLDVCFENFVTQPEAELERISAFIGRPRTAATKRSIRTSGCPRVPDKSSHDDIVRNAAEDPTPDLSRKLDEMMQIYDVHKRRAST